MPPGARQPASGNGCETVLLPLALLSADTADTRDTLPGTEFGLSEHLPEQSMSSSHPPGVPSDENALQSLACAEATTPEPVNHHIEPLLPHIEIVTDRLILALVRFICSAYVTGRASCWHAALESAEEVLGPANGPAFFARAAGVVRALRKERSRAFQFLPPACELASPDERALLSLLHATRRPDPAILRARAAVLTGHNRSASTVTAIIALSGVQIHHHLEQGRTADPGIPGAEPGTPSAVAKPRLH